MIFSSHVFLLGFLPVVFLGYLLLSRLQRKFEVIIWLTACSYFFYGWWNPSYLILIFGSVVVNFSFGLLLGRNAYSSVILWLGIIANLGLLGYYKYSYFFLGNFSGAFSLEWSVEQIILPLAISFFTFQQISYLTDVHQTGERISSFHKYNLFVVFFPQLIAGPIVHHKEMMQQFDTIKFPEPGSKDIAIGLTLLTIGLFKKVVLADGISIYASPVFDAVSAGNSVMLFDAWIGAFAYSFQLYFDFSGYCDMALGMALMFGIRLPLNFNSPLKSSNMIEFWRRWHMTLSRFLQRYLFLPLSMNELRRGWTKQPVYSFIATMFLGGLWHGANWTFVLWGLLNGILLAFTQVWFSLKKKLNLNQNNELLKYGGIALTFFAWTLTLVLFRSDDSSSAFHFFANMMGITDTVSARIIGDWNAGIMWLLLSAFVVFASPNVTSIFEGHKISTDVKVPTTRSLFKLRWSPNIAWVTVTAFAFVFSVFKIGDVNEFLYFQF